VLARRVIREAFSSGAAICALPAVDTLKRVERQQGRRLGVVATLDRELIWRAQTPQVFQRELLRRALEEARRRKIIVTDDAQAVELIGHEVTVVRGEEDNIKVTVPGDLTYAAQILRKRVRDVD
jgi:2-C-methyl-D-erythritol 4-phosphate cytidylyltransferase